MKLILLAAAAVIAVPAVAQTTTDTQTQTDTSTTAGTQDQSTTADQSMSTTTSATAAGQSMSATTDASAAEQAGGYQPATPPMSGTAAPGATVIFQPSVSPSQAFPPPPPLDHYPICKRGQTDGCMQRGGR